MQIGLVIEMNVPFCLSVWLLGWLLGLQFSEIVTLSNYTQPQTEQLLSFLNV